MYNILFKNDFYKIYLKCLKRNKLYNRDYKTFNKRRIKSIIHLLNEKRINSFYTSFFLPRILLYQNKNTKDILYKYILMAKDKLIDYLYNITMKTYNIELLSQKELYKIFNSTNELNVDFLYLTIINKYEKKINKKISNNQTMIKLKDILTKCNNNNNNSNHYNYGRKNN